MANPSNLYAEKIYSEHPLVLWALDDKADYVSLITESQRNVQNQWTTTGGTSLVSTAEDEPFPDSVTTRLQGSVPVGLTNEITCISTNLVNFEDLDLNLGTFCVGSYFYSNSAFLKSVSIGFEYTDPTTSLIVQKLKTFTSIPFQNWFFISETFDIPNEYTNIRIVIKILTETGAATVGGYEFYLNGISLGQWSEEFNTKSLGVIPQVFPTDIALDTNGEVISATPYGISTDTGYYIVKNNALLAKNSSVPLVFGAAGITKLLPDSSGDPSLIIPGKGFLNEVGRYKEYTIEFWVRINSNTIEPKKIFGPIVGSDGLYVEGGFLTLVIGDNFSSYFVGEWYRPMLIHIRLVRDSVTLLINGEEVLFMPINTEALNLPLSEIDGQSQDWLGFYAYSNVSPIEIDCVAIYSYQVPTIIAKRRFVYGQGVISPEGINSAYGGSSVFIDYSFADYTANYNYPDFAEWQQGSFDNLVTTNSFLTTPNYQLPELFLNNKTLKQFYEDCKVEQIGYAESQAESYKFITFRPNSSWNSEQCYLNFPQLNILSSETKSIYGVFSTTDVGPESGIIQSQTLLKIYNFLTKDFFIIKQEEDLIHYVLRFNGIEEVLYTTESIEPGQLFAVGVDISKISSKFGERVNYFFANQNELKMYVGGDEEIENTFTGKIYSVGFSTESNKNEIQTYFDENGFVLFDDLSESGTIEDTAIALIEHTASYTLLPTESYNKLFLDIGVSGFWQDYLPLSYFAQYVTNDVGNTYYDLDFLQFNIGYPSPTTLVEDETILQNFEYDQLKTEYKNPVQKTYNQLDNPLYTSWDNYEDMSEKSEKFYEYDTTASSVRSYITFQYISEGANLPQSYFINIEKPRIDKIIDINDYPMWKTTKFEVLDNFLIYPTKTIDFNDLAIVFQLEFKVRNTLRKSIKLNRLEFASQALNDNSFNPVGTRFGVNLFPYKRSGIYYDYKGKNPFTIYKHTTPYLYLTDKSGIEVRGNFNQRIDRGIAVPINQQLAAEYRVSAIQLWIRYNEESFSLNNKKLFEVEYKQDTIEFYIVASNKKGTRAKIYAKSKLTKQNYNNLSYYWNGVIVKDPFVTVKEWGVLGITFDVPLNFDAYLGNINLNGPVLFNNVAYFEANNLQEVQSNIFRPWLDVKIEDETELTWAYWSNNYTWKEMSVLFTSSAYGVNPSNIHSNYIGTNKIVVDDEEGMIFDAETIKIYNNIIWQQSVQIPV